MMACCGYLMWLWKRWGDGTSVTSTPAASKPDEGGEGGAKESEESRLARWSVMWKMASSRHYVRSFVKDQSLDGDYGWVSV
jgi:hypothetical protein